MVEAPPKSHGASTPTICEAFSLRIEKDGAHDSQELLLVMERWQFHEMEFEAELRSFFDFSIFRKGNRTMGVQDVLVCLP